KLAHAKKEHSLLDTVRIAGQQVVLAFPQTYMNDSGRAVGEAVRFHKLDVSDIVVFHDELDLAPGKIKVKSGGGNAGHNGLRSISEHMGNDYKRARLGIGHPGAKELVHSYVLSDFSKAERPWVETLCDAIADNAGLLARNQDSSFQNKIHLTMVAKGFDTNDSNSNDR
ncbi:MAG: aminoacyl-tRNA hydrolase, partial [Pseudorhodoplanes sp.]